RALTCLCCPRTLRNCRQKSWRCVKSCWRRRESAANMQSAPGRPTSATRR
ncbi:DnaJ domain-containing protein, partial [Toxoplasma gondii TgCatPRC2]